MAHEEGYQEVGVKKKCEIKYLFIKCYYLKELNFLRDFKFCITGYKFSSTSAGEKCAISIRFGLFRKR